jgi:hypothetical protein
VKRAAPHAALGAGLIVSSVAALLWLMIPSEPSQPEANDGSDAEHRKKTIAFDDDESISGLEVTPADAMLRAARREQQTSAQAIAKLEPNSPEFNHHVDDVLPAHLYQEAVSKCYQPGLDRNERVTLRYRLRAQGGKLAVTDLAVLDGKMAPELQDCIVEAVRTATWRDERMPDWQDDDELYIQVGGMKKFLGDDVENPDERLARPSAQPSLEDNGEGAVVATNPEAASGG